MKASVLKETGVINHKNRRRPMDLQETWSNYMLWSMLYNVAAAVPTSYIQFPSTNLTVKTCFLLETSSYSFQETDTCTRTHDVNRGFAHVITKAWL